MTVGKFDLFFINRKRIVTSAVKTKVPIHLFIYMDRYILLVRLRACATAEYGYLCAARFFTIGKLFVLSTCAGELRSRAVVRVAVSIGPYVFVHAIPSCTHREGLCTAMRCRGASDRARRSTRSLTRGFSVVLTFLIRVLRGWACVFLAMIVRGPPRLHAIPT